jgi:xanthine dehydrogenase large subunit
MNAAKDISVSRDAVADPDVRTANARAGDMPPADLAEKASLAQKPASTQAAGRSTPHESARAQVAGAATYVDDIPEVRGTLHAAPILSTVAHGKLLGIDTAAALAMPGVRDVILARDIPGDPVLGNFSHDEPVFAQGTVQHIGQVIGVVVADTVMQARRAARKVVCRIEALPAVLTVHDALKAESYVLPPVFRETRRRGGGAQKAPHTLHGTLEVGGQEHFYLEGQVAYVVPQEQQQWLVYSSTQHPGEIQHWVSHALGVANHAVRVECRRMGGGFGGKETQSGQMAVWAAIAAHKLQMPHQAALDRDDDFMVTGKRHPFAYEYDVGFDDTGRLTGLKLTMAVNCGFSADLSGPVADRAVFHADNAYFLEDVEIASFRCKTNTQSNTAFRGFGGPQGMIVIEAIMGDIARTLGLDPLEVRKRNLYSDEVVAAASATAPERRRDTTHYQMKVEDNILAPLLSKLELSASIKSRRQAISAWNGKSPVIKRGIAITPVKFGISFTATLFNQAGALVHVYTDGSVQVNHGGTEMGQGLNTKVAQIVADELGVPFDQVLATASDTSKIPNASATAASAGTDLNGARRAIRRPQCTRQPGAICSRP